jgi:hypothetical protein
MVGTSIFIWMLRECVYLEDEIDESTWQVGEVEYRDQRCKCVANDQTLARAFV